MWHKQNEDLIVYKRDAAKVFNYVLHAPFVLRRWGHCLFATHQGLQKELYLVASKGFYTPEEDTRIRLQYERWLLARTAGLVETYSSNDLLLDTSIKFIHRSVREFLEGTIDGRAIMGYDNRSTEENYLTFFRIARDTAHIRTTMFRDYKDDPTEYRVSIQMDCSTAMTFLILLHLKGVGGEKLVDSPEWMPPTHQTLLWSQVLLNVAAFSGDVTLLYQTQHSEVFERISQQVKSQVLFACCERSSAWIRAEWMMESHVLETVQAIDSLQDKKLLSSQILLEKLLRKTACVEWLLKHGANPGLCYEGSVMRHTYLDLVQPWDIHHASAFQLFVSNAFWNCVLLSQLNLSSAALARYAEAVQGCVKAMEEHIRNSDANVLILQRDPLHKFLFWLNIACTLNFINRLASSPDPIDISTALLRNPGIVQLRAVKYGQGHWQQPSPTNDVENITKLDTLFLTKFSSDLIGIGVKVYGETSGLNFPMSRLFDHIAALSWENVQEEDAELFSKLSTHISGVSIF